MRQEKRATDFMDSAEASAEAKTKTDRRAPCYTIERTKDAPDWPSIPVLSLDQILWESDCGIRAFGQFCCDGASLYVHLYALEQNIRAENTAPLSPVYQDSCLEFFFMPEGEDRYFNFEINPNGCLYIEFGRSRSDRFALYRRNMSGLFDIRSSGTEDGWEVYYRIPLEFLRLYYPDFVFSGNLLANVYKCGDLTAARHYLSWNPVASKHPDFHRPEDFGKMVFSGGTSCIHSSMG